MAECFFVTDLHGKRDRYEKLFSSMEKLLPEAVFIGGDLLPHHMKRDKEGDFIHDYIFLNLRHLKDRMKKKYPHVFLILGNDDARSEETFFIEGDHQGLFHYISQKKSGFGEYKVFGYSFIPPTPFLLKDWEKYDVSRYVDPGCIHPTEGSRTVDPGEDIEYATIRQDLENLTLGEDLKYSVFLFHSPPYDTFLDRAALDGKMVDHVPLDVHVGSIAIRRFIEEKQPLITLHGHIHESTRITGQWKQMMGNTVAMNAAHDGPELAIVKFDPEQPAEATRELL
jgi:Icc-related predicted phosphoesterase